MINRLESKTKQSNLINAYQNESVSVKELVHLPSLISALLHRVSKDLCISWLTYQVLSSIKQCVIHFWR